MKKKDLLMPYNIQFFAEEGDGAGTDDGNGSGSGEGQSGDAGENPPALPSFDDFLQGEGNQAEFDRRVQQAIGTAVTKAQEKWEILADDRASEAEKLAKMTKDEKERYLLQKQQNELQSREAEITRRELMAEAKNTLAEKKLPAGLAGVLNYTDADACNKSIEAVEKAFQTAVETAVQERLKGGEPLKKASENSNDYETRLADARKTGDNLTAIQIKQEAAEKGIVLI